MTRVLVYIDDLFTKGGGERVAMYFLKSLLEKRIDVYFLALTDVNTFEEINNYYQKNREKFVKGWLFSRLLYVIPKKNKIISMALDYLFLFSMYIHLFFINRKIRPDMFIVIANTIYQNVPFIFHKKRIFSWGLTPFTKKWVLFFHNIILRLGLKKGLLTLVVGSKQQKQMSDREYKSYISVIPIGYDDILFNYSGEKKIRNRIAYVARISPEKRVDLAVEAARLLKERYRDFQVVIIGDSQNRRYYEEIKKKITKYKLSSYVKMIPKSSPAIIKKNLLEAEVFWNFSEGYGGVVNCEALACGCIPVVFKNFKDQIGDNGYAVNNLEEAVEATIKILEMNEKDRRKLALKCSRYAKKYSRSIFEKKLIKLVLHKLQES
ncbi:MAG: hypothetical protein B6U95_02730 [Thermofilum sp. ex4484_82]|nr:MAG: hypothetical protein B6U95_02730 [Thermofilum sp. ex4484_82]OYT39098.1 MAG: hypothetical protein B6U96_02725 [Archaeoglobales archaeon ex4484_92]